ncbi:hypothetical protein DFJ74DRAFT_625290 [Hyaloraphidium curvatum]|nr:hypothetical protein DFJ74DRAFT_625290 [Hyaloraphidium curvatum]
MSVTFRSHMEDPRGRLNGTVGRGSSATQLGGQSPSPAGSPLLSAASARKPASLSALDSGGETPPATPSTPSTPHSNPVAAYLAKLSLSRLDEPSSPMMVHASGAIDGLILDDDAVPEWLQPAQLQRALTRAASDGDAVRIRNLLEAAPRPDPNMPDADGVTPLVLAACYGHTGAAQELLLHGADPDVPDADGWTPLIWAANNRHASVCRVLLRFNASAAKQTARGRTVRDFAGDDPELRDLLEGAADEPETPRGHIGDGSMDDSTGMDKLEFSDDEGTVVSSITAMTVNGSPAFDFTKCLPDQMFVFSPKDIPHIMDVLVRRIMPFRVRRGAGAGTDRPEDAVPIPANVLYLAARYAHYYHGGDLLDALLDAAGQKICLALNEHRDDLNHLCHWLAQITQLVYYLKRDLELSVATATFQARFAELCGDIYLMVVRNAQRRLALVLEECILQHEAIPLERPQYDGRRGNLARRMAIKPREPPRGVIAALEAAEGRAFPQPSPAMVISILNSILFVLRLQKVHRTTVHLVFRQIFYFLSAWTFNLVVDTPDYCTRHRAVQAGLNLSALEEWVRGNAGALPERKLGLLRLLQPCQRLLQLLQAMSTLSDLDSFLEVQGTFVDPMSPGGGVLSPAAPAQQGGLTMPQVRRAMAQYRYEAGEPRVADEVEQYVEHCCAALELQRGSRGGRGGGMEEEDPLRDRFDPEFYLPFKMPALARTDGGWSGSAGKSIARVPIVPDEVLAMLDSSAAGPAELRMGSGTIS